MNEPNSDQRRYIDGALKKLGVTLDELADRLDYKSLRRIRNGEFPLPHAKRKHIEDLMRLSELEEASRESITLRDVEEPAAAVPADIAHLDDESLADSLAEMLRSYIGINPVFAKTARAQIEAVYQEWKRRAEAAGRNGVNYSFNAQPKPKRK